MSNALIGGVKERHTQERSLLTVREVAERLGIGRSTVYELTAAGELEVVHIGRCARIPFAAVEEFVQRKRGSAVTKP
jgi:excisionase family DNA binding protein